MPPAECQKFLQAFLADDASGLPAIEERFRRGLLAREVYPEDQLPELCFPTACHRRKKVGKTTTVKPLVLSNASVAPTAAEAPREGLVKEEPMETMVGAKETIATMLGRLGIPGVGHDVMVFVVATPSSTGVAEPAIASGTASLSIDGQEKVGAWKRGSLDREC